MAGTAGRSGRRPKPTARKALAGNPGKRALNKDEPVFTPIKGVEPTAITSRRLPAVSKMPSMPFRPCRLRLHLRQAWSH